MWRTSCEISTRNLCKTFTPTIRTKRQSPSQHCAGGRCARAELLVGELTSYQRPQAGFRRYQPLACSSLINAVYPFLSSVLNARVEMRSVTKRPSSGTQMRFFCKFGKKRRRVLLFACETLLPYMTVLPVNSQTFDMTVFPESVKRTVFLQEYCLALRLCIKSRATKIRYF